MNKDFKMIGIGCCGLVGKDTLFKILDSLFPNKLERVALADNLKGELDEFCQRHYKISAFTKNPVEKEIIRGLFVSHGKVKRIISKGQYWTNLVQERINDIIHDGLIPVCTDIRYSYYPEDEIFWLKEKNKGVYIHVNRYNNGEKILALNSEEMEQEKILENQADFRLNWATNNDINYLTDIASAQLKPLLDIIKEKYIKN